MEALGYSETLVLTYKKDYTYFFILTYLQSWALTEKLPTVQPLRNFPAF
jgi:hypothetical protein